MTTERFHWMRTVLRRWFRRGRQEAEMDAEMQFHFDQLVAEFRANGMSKAEARSAARREFGTADVYREEVRDSWRPSAVGDALRDLRFAARSLRRTPGFSVLAIITLGLGIGANTGMFSVLNEVVLRPVPFVDPERLDSIYRATPQDPQGNVSALEFAELKTAVDHYESYGAYVYLDASMAPPGEPADIAPAAEVTAGFLSTLGLQPRLGRSFRPEEASTGRNHVVLLSERCWQNRFGGREDVIGTTVRINSQPHEIIGVLPKAFSDWRLFGWMDFLRPMDLSDARWSDRRHTEFRVYGRRAAGVTPSDAAGAIAAFGESRAAAFPDENAEATWRTVLLQDAAAGPNGPLVLSMLVGLSGFVVLICCSNLANFLLARTMSRSRELAMRSALGASRGQLLRPLLWESLLLSLGGAVLAIWMAYGFAAWLAVRSTADNGDRVEMSIDANVFFWTLACSLFTTLVFSLAPSLFALRLNLNQTLKSGGRGATDSPGQRRLRQALIAGQFALALVLLTGATVFIRGLDALNAQQIGWRSDRLITAAFLLSEGEYPDAASRRQLHQEVLERLPGLPGIASASLAQYQPFLRWWEQNKFSVVGRPPAEGGREPAAGVNAVSPDYFDTVATRIIAGRAFDDRDHAGATHRIIINETLARTVFPNENPIGQSLHWLEADGAAANTEIIGVAEDVAYIYPEANPVVFQAYRSLAQSPPAFITLAARATVADPALLIGEIRNLMQDIDPDLPVTNLKTATDRIARENYQLGVLRDLLSMFAILGLVLASLGIYGMIARLVAQRHGEFGIRIALGATAGNINRLVLASSFWMLLWGATLGILGGIGISKLLQVGFPNMPHAPVSSMTVALAVLMGVALFASLWPARRASAIDPCEALRTD